MLKKKKEEKTLTSFIPVLQDQLKPYKHTCTGKLSMMFWLSHARILQCFINATTTSSADPLKSANPHETPSVNLGDLPRMMPTYVKILLRRFVK